MAGIEVVLETTDKAQDPETSGGVTGYKAKLDQAIKEVFETLNSMTKEGLAVEIDKHKDDPRALAILYAWDCEAL